MAHSEQEANIISNAKCFKPVQKPDFRWKAVDAGAPAGSPDIRSPKARGYQFPSVTVLNGRNLSRHAH
jgi:hypothetical protein